ncbi:MAG TPA: hypothetical protein H9903_16840 [Candidatus Aquabacterium excrementipullorum]|nr:hypothetical protein [Candidatus Aquabacterium excrementipullorum]
MISYDRSSGSRWVWLVAGVAVLGSATAAWWWFGSNRAAETVATAEAASAPGPGPVVNLAAPVSEAPDGRPNDFTPQEWSSLKEAVGNKPDGVKELKRITAFLRYQRGFEQWQALQDSSKTAERHALAQQLLDQLPDRIANMEMTMGESLLICGVLLTDLEPDEAARTQKMEACKTKLEGLAPKLDNEQALRDAECRTEFLRRQAAIVAEYQAQPESQRNQAKFEKDIETARRSVYDSPNCGR